MAGQFNGKVALVTGGSSGMAAPTSLASLVKERKSFR